MGSPTTNYGWTMPTVGGDTDAWGGELNTSLAGIDGVVHGIDVRISADAPDATLYARKAGAWQHITHNDITDWVANQYVLPTAAIGTLGGVKIDGTSIVISGGTISTGPNWAGGVVSGPVDLARQVVTQSGGSLAINRALGENCSLSLSASLTAITVSGWPASGTTGKVRLVIVNGGAFAIPGSAWPAGTIWPAGTPPTITSGSGKTDIILLMSDNAGTTIWGSVVGQDYR